jgi:sugar phosphate permease
MNVKQDGAAGWMVVAGCTFGGIFSLPSVFTNVVPALTVPIEQATGWSREAIQGGFAVHLLGSFIAIPICGLLVDRVGARAVILVSQLLLAIGIASVSFTSSIPLFYASFVLLAFLGTGTGPVPYSKIIVEWFAKYRGIALGISVMGVGAVGGVLAILTTYFTKHYGWGGALQAMALITALMVVPLFFMLRDYPRAIEENAKTEEAGSQPTEGNWSFLRQSEFWLLAVSFLIAGVGQIGIVFNLIPMQIDRGMSAESAAGLTITIGATFVVGRLIGGLLLDRFETPKIASGGLVFAAVGLAWLGAGASGSQAYVAAALLGLTAGIETDILPYMISRYFDRATFGRIFAVISTMTQLAIVSPVGMTALRTQTGDYSASCYLGCALVILAAAMMWFLPRYRFDAKVLDPLQPK